ncbi:helix-turn-helix domain-containing protein [Priestia megaterium]|uniref:helix-turn-helix domain-containing protein n=1 Tax=Priestia megaterium TaxID=1404 RepID=UPI000BF4EE32|nr:helix-turn-helix domain-containing protein [Priestia megaterium]PFI60727.1 hypothetical protein COI68_26125 [Priestia megaterium]PFT49763.1 hypothetical protein COK68_28270 [Priestia megaterium]
MGKDQFLEERVHGHSMFPFKVYKIDSLEGDAIIHYHWHKELEFIFLVKGRILVQIGTSYIELKSEEAIYIPMGQLHAAYPLTNDSFTLYAIVFSDALLSSFTYDSIQRNYIDLLKQPDVTHPSAIKSETAWKRSILESLVSIIDEYKDKNSAFELTIKARLLLTLSLMIKNNYLVFNKNSSDEGKLNRLKQVLEYIDEHFYEKITISRLSSLLNMSEGHFSRFFKSIVNMTPIEYINIIRVNKASALLKQTDKKIIDISMEVGFDNPSYFIKTFKKQKKCTPSQFRNIL